MKNGLFVISLDFEMLWGMHEKYKVHSPKSLNILNVHNIIPRLLAIFDKYNISATFATVGQLFYSDIESIKLNIPSIIPNYDNIRLSPYLLIESLTEQERAFFCGKDLVELIIECGRHEVASHTYSHYYCLEPGQTLEQFRSDLQSAIIVANNMDIETKSLVFPRNQFNPKYLEECKSLGIKVVRSTERCWMYKPSAVNGNKLLKRFFRLLDTYINISGHNCYNIDTLITEPVIQLPSSRFLRPFSKRLRFLDYFRLKRIKDSMTYAAEHNEIFHIWWHPHNMSEYTDENFAFLEKILRHYSFLHEKYNFHSVTMKSIV